MVAQRLEIELLDLRDRYKIGAEDLLPAEIVDLVHACEIVDNPFRGNRAVLDLPYTLKNGDQLWALSIGANVWLEEYARRWWDNKRFGAMYDWSIYFAMYYSRNREIFTNLTDRKIAFKAVQKWALKQSAPYEELEEAFVHFYGDLEPDDDQLAVDETKSAGGSNPVEKEKKKKWDEMYKCDKETEKKTSRCDFVDMISTLEAETGIGATYWLWGRSMKETVKVYEQCVRFISIQAGDDQRGLKDDLDRAINALARVKLRIYKRLKGKENGR